MQRKHVACVNRTRQVSIPFFSCVFFDASLDCRKRRDPLMEYQADADLTTDVHIGASISLSTFVECVSKCLQITACKQYDNYQQAWSKSAYLINSKVTDAVRNWQHKLTYNSIQNMLQTQKNFSLEPKLSYFSWRWHRTYDWCNRRLLIYSKTQLLIDWKYVFCCSKKRPPSVRNITVLGPLLSVN